MCFSALTTKCGSVSGLSNGREKETDPVPLAIAVVATFVITALAVSFLAIVIGLIVNARRNKNYDVKKEYGLGSVNGEKI